MSGPGTVTRDGHGPSHESDSEGRLGVGGTVTAVTGTVAAAAARPCSEPGRRLGGRRAV